MSAGEWPPSSSGESSSGWFHQTSWTQIRRVQGEDGEIAAEKALEQLCQAYRRPIMTAFRRKHGLSAEDSEDATQDFMVWFLNSELLGKAQKQRGRFRTYLLTCLDNFARNLWRKGVAQKRGGGAIHVSIHPDTASSHPGLEIPDQKTPDQEIAVEWARATLNAARSKLKASESKAGKREEWRIMREFLSTTPSVTMEQAAAKLEITLSAMKVRIHRFRQQFHACLTEQVSATVSSEEEFQEEMNLLRDVFA